MVSSQALLRRSHRASPALCLPAWDGTNSRPLNYLRPSSPPRTIQLSIQSSPIKRLSILPSFHPSSFHPSSPVSSAQRTPALSLSRVEKELAPPVLSTTRFQTSSRGYSRCARNTSTSTTAAALTPRETSSTAPSVAALAPGCASRCGYEPATTARSTAASSDENQ